jgi:hypothetical protein
VPEVSSQRSFANFKKHVEISVQRYDEGEFTPDFLAALVNYQSESSKFMETMFEKSLKRKKVIEEVEGDSSAAIEKLKIRSEDFKDSLSVEGLNLNLIDVIVPLDSDSEKAHSWTISDEKDRYRTRQKLKYPDGKVVEDTGVAFEGGSLSFELKNVEPGKDIYMIWRMDYVHGDWEAQIEGNGRRLENCICSGQDRKFRWRNWVYVIPAEHVREVAMKVNIKPVTADRDINVFHMWAYQPAKKTRRRKK